MAGLLDQAASGLNVRSDDGRSPRAVLVEIRKRVEELSERQARLWNRELDPGAFAAGGIVLGRVRTARGKLVELKARFHEDIYPVLPPLAVGPDSRSRTSRPLAQPGVFVQDPESGEERLAREGARGVPRFFEVGARGLFIPLEDVDRPLSGRRLFRQMEISESGRSLRLTRVPDFEVSDEADDLLEAVELSSRRRFGDIVRVELSSSSTSAAGCSGAAQARPGVADDQIYLVPVACSTSRTRHAARPSSAAGS